MGIFTRFKDIISANINDLLDKAENPAKMIDEYLRQAVEDLEAVKDETAGIIADEKKAKRELEENTAEIERYTSLAQKAVEAGNDEDAKAFITKKQELAKLNVTLTTAFKTAHDNAVKMRQLHDKLSQDIKTLTSRRDEIKAKVKIAQTQEKINELGSSAADFDATMGAIARMEEKANRLLDKSQAMAELDEVIKDDVTSLEEKYEGVNDKSVDDELAALKASLGK